MVLVVTRLGIRSRDREREQNTSKEIQELKGISICLVLVALCLGGCGRGGSTSPGNGVGNLETGDGTTRHLASWKAFVDASKGRTRSEQVRKWDEENHFQTEITFLSDDLVKSNSVQHPIEGLVKLRLSAKYGPGVSNDYEYNLRFSQDGGKWIVVGGTAKNLKKGNSWDVNDGKFTGEAYVLRFVFDL